MGQEIVYCFKCQKRILGADYAKGLAFQLENNSCCSACAVVVLDTLPPKAKEQLLGKMFKATQERQSTSSGSVKAKSGQVRESTTSRIPVLSRPVSNPRLQAGAPARNSMPLILGIGALVAVVLVLWIVGFSGGTASISPPESGARRRAPSAEPPPDPGPSPEEKRRSESAKEALRKAREFAQAHPKDLEGQTQQWRTALAEAERTGYEADAKRELDRTLIRATEAAGEDLAQFEREVRKLKDRKDFKAALDTLSRERERRATPEWTAASENLEREVRETAARLLAELKAKAVAARDRGAQDEVAAAKAEVARWGLVEPAAELTAALEPPWHPIFDGRTLDAFPSGVQTAWRVEDGYLIHDNAVDNAAITRENFGDGEIRVRFELKGVTKVSFRFRLEGNAHYHFVLEGPTLATLGEGEHELLLSSRDDTASATLDGKALPLLKIGKPRPGMIQFNAAGGSFRIKSMEFRKLP
ncbi:MAG TPA: hypothetical protein VKU80_13440 [Planctomycetota bacterium]|nr:hypothetical protein [Planctomycetota bacterium]